MRKNSGLKNEKQVQKILVSGSAVLQEKNSAGIRIVRAKKEKPNAPYIKGYPDLSEIPTDNYGNLSEAGILTNDKIDGGIIGGKLIRPKYDRDELEKSIDTDIFELIPNEPVELPDTVLRSIYDEATNNISTLTTTIETLNSEVLQLTSKVSELEVVSESLKIQADSEILKASTLEIQNGIINLKISETTIDLQNKDYLSPGVINFRPTPGGNAITYPYGIKSQYVPFYQWGLEQGSTQNIFGTELNNWKTNQSPNINSSGIFGYKYQSLDRRNINPPTYFVGANNTNDIYQRGYIFNVNSSGNYSFSMAGVPSSKFLVGAPNHFYFGIIKGQTALDKFKTKYSVSE